MYAMCSAGSRRLKYRGKYGGVRAFGFFLPVIWVRTKHWYTTTLLSFAFSLCVETAQLVFKVGSFDADDILLNTLGGILGYLIFVICNRIRRRKFG